MSLFEDILEVHYNAQTRIEGSKTVGTFQAAVEKNAHEPIDITIVADWDTLHHIEDGLMDIELDLDIPEKHVETSCKRIERRLDTKVLVMGTESSNDFAVALNPIGVNYANEVIAPSSVVAIDFE